MTRKEPETEKYNPKMKQKMMKYHDIAKHRLFSQFEGLSQRVTHFFFASMRKNDF